MDRLSSATTKVRLGALLVAAALAVASCGGTGSGANRQSSSTGNAQTLRVSLPAGPNPSKSARMICAARLQSQLAYSLGVRPIRPVVPTWVDHLYSCRWIYGNGVLVLSVKELSSAAETTAYYEMLARKLGDAGRLTGLGDGAYATSDGSVVARKDYKVLLVDVAGLPGEFGKPATTRSDVAITISDSILGCWTGD